MKFLLRRLALQLLALLPEERLALSRAREPVQLHHKYPACECDHPRQCRQHWQDRWRVLLRAFGQAV